MGTRVKHIEILFRCYYKGHAKYGKHRYTLQVRYDKILTCFLSDKQKRCIDREFCIYDECYPRDPIYGAFEDDRFIWASRDAKDLCKYFDVPEYTIPDVNTVTWAGTVPVLEVPKNVEIADELKDNIT